MTASPGLRRDRRLRWAGSAFLLASALGLPAARAQDLVPQAQRPPPTELEYLQYGVAIVGEPVVSPGDVCPGDGESGVPCILDSGGGLAVRFGYRSRGPWYLGGAYEFSRHDSSNLLRLAILQQLRAEVRYYTARETRLTPYVGAALGGVIYGSEWGAQTGGLMASLGGALELQVSEVASVGAGVFYRPLLLRGWTDSAGERRADRYAGFGLAHLVALELIVELKDPLPRW